MESYIFIYVRLLCLCSSSIFLSYYFSTDDGIFFIYFYPHAYVMQRGWCDWEQTGYRLYGDPVHIHVYVHYTYKARNSHQRIKPPSGYCMKLYSCIRARKKLKPCSLGHPDYISGKNRAICVNLYCFKNKNDKSL